MRNNYSNYLGVVTSAGASDEHPLSIHSASIRRRWHSRGMQLICTLVLLFTFSIGQMWGTTQTIGFTTATCAKNASSGGERSFTNVTNLTVAPELVSTTSGALATYTTADKEFQFSNKNDKVYSRGGYKWNVNTGTTLGTTNNTVGYSVVVGSGYQFTIDSISFAIGATANMIYQVIIYQGSDTLYKSSQLTFTRDNTTSNPNHTLKVNGLSAQSALQNLTGTFYVRARFAFNSTGKYFFLPAFTVTGDLHEAGGGGGGNVAPSISAPTADSEAIYLLNAEASGLSVTASGTPDPSYQWYYKASKDATDSTEVGSATSSSYTPLTTSAYDRYYYCKVSNSEGSKVSKFFRVQVLEEALTPTTTFNDGSYIIEDWDLDLSSLFTSNSAGAVTYSITDAGTTGALLRADGKSLYATTAGSATVQASQAANGIYAAKVVTATVTVAADENLILKARLTGSNGATKTLSGSLKTGAVATVQALASSSPYKLNKDFYAYVALTLPSGEYFQEGDSVVLDLSKTGQIYCGTLPADGASEFPEGSVLLGTTTKKGSIEYYVLPNTLPANTSTIYTSRSTSAYNGTLTSMAVYRIPETPACAATVPGNISKGDLTAGEITLTADGSAESGDTWYWQSSATGEDKTGTSGATKTVNAAGTYYIRSYNESGNCWSAAKSIELTAEDFLATPEVTFNNGAYVVGASALNLSTLFTSQNTSAVSFALKVASDDATVSGNNFTATKAGSYVIVATQAADANYKAVSEEATITVTYPATGEATILYNVAVGTENTALGTASKEDNSASISNLSNFTAAGGLTVSGRGAGKDGLSTKLQTLSSQDYAKYIYVTFDVADGKEFVLDSISTEIVAVTTAKTIKIVVSDTESTKDSLDYSQGKNSTAAHHQFNFTSSAKAYAGTVTVKIYAYGATDDYRLGQPLKVCGTVQAAATKYNVTFAKNGGSGADMATLKYAEDAVVTLPECSFTAPTNKEFDAWVVAPTAGGDEITVTAGKFTMPAEAVTVTATWKFLPKLTLSAGEGATGDDVVSYHAAGTEISVPAKPEGFSKGTDEFTGWAYSPSVSVEAGKFNMPSSDLTLTAQWASAAAVAQIVGGDSYGTFADAIAAIGDGETIKLLADCSFDDKWTITGKTVTLDMNGNNLAGPAGGDGVEVGDGGKLILTDGSVMEDPAINGSNEITYAGGKLTGKWPINVVAGGEFEMNGGWIVGGEAAVWVGYTGVVTINNGVLEAMDNAVVMAPGNAGKGGYTINVHGGILLGHIQTAGYASMVIYHPNVGTLNIDGGKLISTNGPAVVIRGGDSNITGGEIVAQGTGTGKCGDASQLLGAVGIAADFKSAYPGVANTDVAISGTINVIAAADEAVQAIYADATPTSAEVAAVAVSGGTFNRELTQEVCAENYAPKDNGNGTYGVKPLATTIDFEGYYVTGSHGTVAEALAAHNYTLTADMSDNKKVAWDNNPNAYDKGLKIKEDAKTFSFEVAAGKLVAFKTGIISGATLSVNGGAADDLTITAKENASIKTRYYYNAAVQNFVFTTTTASYNIIKSVTIEDPYVVTFNANGGEDVAAMEFHGTALTLPGATNGTQIFKGWYDADTEGNLIGKAGDSYTPTASITLHAQWETVSSDNTLSALEVDNVALADFDPDKHIYNIVCEYGHTPQITLATATAEAQGATVTIVNTPVDGDGYKYIQANVIPASGTPIGYNQVRYTNLPKKGVSLIKVTIPNGTGNTQTIEEANITGYIGGTATQKLESGKHKLGSGGHFIGMTLAEGTFQENDLVIVNVEEIKTDLMRVFKENTAAEDNVVASSTANMTVGDNYVTLGATTTNSLYLRRGTNDENYQTGWNPFIGSFEVQRYMDPFIEEFKIGEAVGTISKDEYENNIISVEVPYSTDITSLTPTIKAWANGGATLDKTGAQDFSSAVVYKVSSAYEEDGEVAYTVNVTKAEASHAATLSDIKLDGVSLEGFDPATLSYDVELEKGTLAYPTVTYTAATGATVVPNSATFPGAYNLVVTAEDGETTQTYTINFTVSTKIKVVIFDGTVAAQADALKASPDGTTGASWSLVDLSVSSSSFTGYNYQIATGGQTSTSKHIAVTVPANYLPQFVITQVTNSNNTARSALVGTSTARPATADALFYVTNSDQANPSTGTSDQLNEETTYYIHSDASINFLKIALLLEPILPKCEAPALSGLADMNVCALGDALSVTATTTDGGSFAYQWYKKGETDTEVGTDSNEFIPEEEGQYYVVVTHSLDEHRDNATTSDVVTVSLKTATAITTAPANQRGAVGAQVTLSVTAAGEGLSYAWYTCDNEAGENPVALEPAVTAASLQVTITENMNQWYKVVVTGDCGAESATALVEEWTEVEQADVTGSMIWDWTKSCWDGHSDVQLPNDKINVDTLMANTGTSIVNNSEFRSDMLVIRGQYAWRQESSKRYFQGFGVKFHATVPGMVKVTYRGTGESKKVILSIGNYTAAEYAGGYTTVQAVVPAGDVVITGIGGTGNENGMVRINKIEFDANLSSYEFSANPFEGYERPEVTPGVYGTICLPKAGVMTGASIFEVAYMTYENNNPYKVFFDEVLNGTMVAGRPYIFIPNEDVTAIRVYYTDAANASAGDYRGLHGTFDHMNGEDLLGKYIFYNNMIFESKNTQNWLDENRAYIVLSDVPDYITPVNPSSRRIALGVNGTNTATGFENAAADEAPVKMMIDGKLFILRGEKLFDATGKLVK